MEEFESFPSARKLPVLFRGNHDGSHGNLGYLAPFTGAWILEPARHNLFSCHSLRLRRPQNLDAVLH